MVNMVLYIRAVTLIALFGGMVGLGGFSYGVVGQEVAARSAAVSSLSSSALLTVAFLDVGQGDAIFIETPDGVQVLIDGGPNNSVLRELGKQMSILDRDIDLLIATHPDKDHIGGLIDVLDRYKVQNILLTKNRNDTVVADVFEYKLSTEHANVREAKAGEIIKLGEKVYMQILFPAFDVQNWESNSSSIVTKLSYGDVDFMLTGDAPLSVEEHLIDIYADGLESEVLKLGHHGSKTSSGEDFLMAVKPKYAVVSAGENNTYGHPHEEVVERVEEVGIKILNTIESGTVVFKSDGKEVWVK